jgi:hypothetical protein
VPLWATVGARGARATARLPGPARGFDLTRRAYGRARLAPREGRGGERARSACGREDGTERGLRAPEVPGQGAARRRSENSAEVLTNSSTRLLEPQAAPNLNAMAAVEEQSSFAAPPPESASIDELRSALHESLDQRGVLGRIRAQSRRRRPAPRRAPRARGRPPAGCARRSSTPSTPARTRPSPGTRPSRRSSSRSSSASTAPGREKAPLSAVFHSFRLIFGQAIIPRSALEAWMLFLERARAEHSR